MQNGQPLGPGPDTLDDAARRTARKITDRHHSPAIALHRQLLRQCVRVVVAALDVDVRPDRLEQVDRGVVLENGHVFHTADRRDNRRPVLGRADRPIRSLQPAHGLIGIDPDDEHVAEGRGLLKAFNVAAVKDVETTISEDDPVACAAMPG